MTKLQDTNKKIMTKHQISKLHNRKKIVIFVFYFGYCNLVIGHYLLLLISSRFSVIRFFTCLRKSTWAVSPVNSFGETGGRARRHTLEGKNHQRFGGRSLSVPVMHNGTMGTPVSTASLKGPE